ncbi:MAG TPA: radical SAM protein [Thermodesulfobacteriota bacterium]|nr:radical SAM protein [Thermodesulfobacteriota bacterium]
MKVKGIFAKAILTKTAIPGFDYCINPYVGCGHGCRYCYASFMKRFTGHLEPWGEFIDVKVNAPLLLKKQLKRAKQGVVALSTVTDPYQPIEKKYQLTRRCLEVLLDAELSVNLLTRSPLCQRDMDLLKQFQKIEAGFSIGTHDEGIKKIFEPHAPSIDSRVKALRALHREKIRTYAFVGPMLPLDAKALVTMLEGAVDEVLIDRLNYPNKVKAIYRKAKLDQYLEENYFRVVGMELKERFEKRGIPVSMIF